MAKLWNGPDGQVYEFPDEATDEQIEEFFLLTLPSEDLEGSAEWTGAIGNPHRERTVELPAEHGGELLSFPAEALDYQIHNYLKEQYGLGDRVYEGQRNFEDARQVLGGLSRIGNLEQQEAIALLEDPAKARELVNLKDEVLSNWEDMHTTNPERFRSAIAAVTNKPYETAKEAWEDLSGHFYSSDVAAIKGAEASLSEANVAPVWLSPLQAQLRGINIDDEDSANLRRSRESTDRARMLDAQADVSEYWDEVGSNVEENKRLLRKPLYFGGWKVSGVKTPFEVRIPQEQEDRFKQLSAQYGSDVNELRKQYLKSRFVKEDGVSAQDFDEKIWPSINAWLTKDERLRKNNVNEQRIRPEIALDVYQPSYHDKRTTNQRQADSDYDRVARMTASYLAENDPKSYQDMGLAGLPPQWEKTQETLREYVTTTLNDLVMRGAMSPEAIKYPGNMLFSLATGSKGLRDEVIPWDPEGVKDADTVQKRNEMIESYLKQVRDVDGANPMFAKLFEAYVRLNAANGIDWEEEEFALRKSIVRVQNLFRERGDEISEPQRGFVKSESGETFDRLSVGGTPYEIQQRSSQLGDITAVGFDGDRGIFADTSSALDRIEGGSPFVPLAVGGGMRAALLTTLAATEGASVIKYGESPLLKGFTYVGAPIGEEIGQVFKTLNVPGGQQLVNHYQAVQKEIREPHYQGLYGQINKDITSRANAIQEAYDNGLLDAGGEFVQNFLDDGAEVFQGLFHLMKMAAGEHDMALMDEVKAEFYNKLRASGNKLRDMTPDEVLDAQAEVKARNFMDAGLSMQAFIEAIVDQGFMNAFTAKPLSVAMTLADGAGLMVHSPKFIRKLQDMTVDVNYRVIEKMTGERIKRPVDADGNVKMTAYDQLVMYVDAARKYTNPLNSVYIPGKIYQSIHKWVGDYSMINDITTSMYADATIRDGLNTANFTDAEVKRAVGAVLNTAKELEQAQTSGVATTGAEAVAQVDAPRSFLGRQVGKFEKSIEKINIPEETPAVEMNVKEYLASISDPYVQRDMAAFIYGALEANGALSEPVLVMPGGKKVYVGSEYGLDAPELYRYDPDVGPDKHYTNMDGKSQTPLDIFQEATDRGQRQNIRDLSNPQTGEWASGKNNPAREARQAADLVDQGVINGNPVVLHTDPISYRTAIAQLVDQRRKNGIPIDSPEVKALIEMADEALFYHDWTSPQLQKARSALAFYEHGYINADSPRITNQLAGGVDYGTTTINGIPLVEGTWVNPTTVRFLENLADAHSKIIREMIQDGFIRSKKDLAGRGVEAVSARKELGARLYELHMGNLSIPNYIKSVPAQMLAQRILTMGRPRPPQQKTAKSYATIDGDYGWWLKRGVMIPEQFIPATMRENIPGQKVRGDATTPEGTRREAHFVTREEAIKMGLLEEDGTMTPGGEKRYRPVKPKLFEPVEKGGEGFVLGPKPENVPLATLERFIRTKRRNKNKNYIDPDEGTPDYSSHTQYLEGNFTKKEFESLSPAARKAAELNLKRQELARYIQYAESGNPQLYRPLIEEGVIFTKRTRAEPSYAIGPRPGAEQAARLRNLGERQTLEIRPGASPDQVFKYFEQVRDKTMQIYDRLKATRGEEFAVSAARSYWEGANSGFVKRLESPIEPPKTAKKGGGSSLRSVRRRIEWHRARERFRKQMDPTQFDQEAIGMLFEEMFPEFFTEKRFVAEPFRFPAGTERSNPRAPGGRPIDWKGRDIERALYIAGSKQTGPASAPMNAALQAYGIPARKVKTLHEAIKRDIIKQAQMTPTTEPIQIGKLDLAKYDIQPAGRIEITGPDVSVRARRRLDDKSATNPHPRNLVDEGGAVEQGNQALYEAGNRYLEQGLGRTDLIEQATQRNPEYVANVDQIVQAADGMSDLELAKATASMQQQAKSFSTSVMIERNMRILEEFNGGWDAGAAMNVAEVAYLNELRRGNYQAAPPMGSSMRAGEWRAAVRDAVSSIGDASLRNKALAYTDNLFSTYSDIVAPANDVAMLESAIQKRPSLARNKAVTDALEAGIIQDSKLRNKIASIADRGASFRQWSGLDDSGMLGGSDIRIQSTADGMIDLYKDKAEFVSAVINNEGLLRRLATSFKAAKSAKQLATLVNNVMNNVVLQALIKGDPFALVRGWRDYSEYELWKRNPEAIPANRRAALEAAHNTGVAGQDFTAAELKMWDKTIAQQLGEAAYDKLMSGMDLSPGIMGSIARRGIAAVLVDAPKIVAAPGRWVQKIYGPSDTIFKIGDIRDTQRNFNRYFDAMELGSSIDVPVSNIKTIRVTKNGASTFLIEEPNISPVQVSLGEGGVAASPELQAVAARHGALITNRKFFDYSDRAKLQSVLRKYELDSLFSPYFSWTFKSLYIPGIKTGWLDQMVTGGQSFSTTSRNVGNMQSQGRLSTILKRQIALNSLNTAATFGDKDLYRSYLKQLLSYDLTTGGTLTLEQMLPNIVRLDSQYGLQPFTAQAALMRMPIHAARGITQTPQRSWMIVGKDDENLEAFRDRFKKQRVKISKMSLEMRKKMFGTTNQTVPLKNYIDNLTDEELIALRRDARDTFPGNRSWLADALILGGLEKGMTLDVVEAFQDKLFEGDGAGILAPESWAEMWARLNPLFIGGGTSSAAVDGLIGGVDEESLWSTRRWTIPEPGQPQQPYAEWMVERFTGLKDKWIDLGLDKNGRILREKPTKSYPEGKRRDSVASMKKWNRIRDRWKIKAQETNRAESDIKRKKDPAEYRELLLRNALLAGVVYVETDMMVNEFEKETMKNVQKLTKEAQEIISSLPEQPGYVPPELKQRNLGSVQPMRKPYD